MSAIRKLTVDRPLGGFWEGFGRGLASSVDVYEIPVQRLATRYEAGFKLDVEALRADVGRAKTRIAREIEKSARASKAG